MKDRLLIGALGNRNSGKSHTWNTHSVKLSVGVSYPAIWSLLRESSSRYLS